MLEFLKNIVFKKRRFLELDTIEGIWESQDLKNIPNYNSNFMNWVECSLTIGKIIMKIYKKEEDLFFLEISIPVIYQGGGFGYYPFVEEKINIEKNQFNIIRNNEMIYQIKFNVLSNTKIAINHFDTKLIFEKQIQK